MDLLQSIMGSKIVPACLTNCIIFGSVRNKVMLGVVNSNARSLPPMPATLAKPGLEQLPPSLDSSSLSMMAILIVDDGHVVGPWMNYIRLSIMSLWDDIPNHLLYL
jgi:hypothetical protein